MRVSTYSSILAGALLVIFLAPCSAQEALDQTILFESDEGFHGTSATFALDPDKGHMTFIWVQRSQDFSEITPMLGWAKLKRNGTFKTKRTTTLDQYGSVVEKAAIAWQPEKKRSFVIWGKYIDNFRSELYGQFISRKGKPVGKPVQLLAELEEIKRPYLAYDPETGGFLLSFGLFSGVEGKQGFNVVRLDENGTVIGDPNLIYAVNANEDNAHYSVITSDGLERLGNGNWLAVSFAEYHGSDGFQANYWAALLRSNGSLIKKPRMIETDAFDIAAAPLNDSTIVSLYTIIPGPRMDTEASAQVRLLKTKNLKKLKSTIDLGLTEFSNSYYALAPSPEGGLYAAWTFSNKIIFASIDSKGNRVKENMEREFSSFTPQSLDMANLPDSRDTIVLLAGFSDKEGRTAVIIAGKAPFASDR